MSSNTSTKPSLISNLLHNLKERQFLGLQKKAAKLDAPSSTQLQQYLTEQLVDNDTTTNIIIPDDYELLQTELDKALRQQEALEEKRDFLRVRLQKYTAALQKMETCLGSDPNIAAQQLQKYHTALQKMETAISDPNIAAQQLQKLKAAQQNLKPVQEQYQTIEQQLATLQKLIDSMQQRQLSLKLVTQECHVVLQELQHLNVEYGENGGDGTTAKNADHSEVEEDKEASELELTTKLSATDKELESGGSSVVVEKQDKATTVLLDADTTTATSDDDEGNSDEPQPASTLDVV